MKIPLGNFFSFTMGAGAGDETKTREEDDDNEEVDDLGSQLSFNSSTLENEMPVKMEGGISDEFGIVRSINMATNGMQVSSEFSTTANSGTHAEANKSTITRAGTELRELEAAYEKPLKQKKAARVLIKH